MKKQLFIFYLLTNMLFANESIYTSTSKTKVLPSNPDGYSIVLLKSPANYTVRVGSCGGFMMQLDINGYTLQTKQIPKVIEWRIDDNKKIIGVIVRTYMPILDPKTDDFKKNQYTSSLNVLVFKDKPILLGTRKNNTLARELIDKYYTNLVK